MKLSALTDKRERGFLDGHFLIAMPGMFDSNFARSVVYVCAHSSAGAMGFVINQPQSITFTDVLLHLQLIRKNDAILLPDETRHFPIRSGGPVETGRGFVLHSDDYASDSSIPISDDISLTATLDVVRAISNGRGPRRATMMLGYAGWGAGQLESEMGQNAWLSVGADDHIIFDVPAEDRYPAALKLLGIDPVMLAGDAGHA